MKDFKTRLIDEKVELTERMERLEAFIENGGYSKIVPVQKTLLNIQLKAMDTYAQCLLERIVRL